MQQMFLLTNNQKTCLLNTSVSIPKDCHFDIVYRVIWPWHFKTFATVRLIIFLHLCSQLKKKKRDFDS